MRSLLLHCKRFETAITGLSTRPDDIIHGKISDERQASDDCILALVTVEIGDTADKAESLAAEILKFRDDTHHSNVFLCPFAHLSSNLAKAKDALPIFEAILENLKRRDVLITEGHFGSDKEAFLNLYGHPGNVRFREF